MKTSNHKSSPSTRHRRILIADDDEDIVFLLSEALNAIGYDACPYTKSEEALASFEAEPDQFDMVITDCAMPIMTGIQLSEKIHKLRPELPIIMASGQDELSFEQLKLLGIREFIRKPYRFDSVTSVVEKYLASH